MKERPILFNAPMVRAIIDGRKTQTRRIMKPQPEPIPADYPGPAGHWWPSKAHQSMLHIETEMQDYNGPWKGLAGSACPYGGEGDQLWVRETHAVVRIGVETFPGVKERHYAGIAYKADDGREEVDITPSQYKELDAKESKGWKPSIHMPRYASRIQLEITNIRVERLQDISEVDALAEGIQAYSDGTYRDYNVPDDMVFDHNTFASPVDSYRTLWDTINGPGSWEANPWVWVIEFRRIKP